MPSWIYLLINIIKLSSSCAHICSRLRALSWAPVVAEFYSVRAYRRQGGFRPRRPTRTFTATSTLDNGIHPDTRVY
jgi:hypothetical protein